MQQQEQQPLIPAQQEAIRELRRRYEEGELAYELFEPTLDRLLQAREAEECWAILQELPTPPMSALAALEGRPAPQVVPQMQAQQSQSIVCIMGETKRTKRPWRLAQKTLAVLGMGEMVLDLSLATIPQYGTLNVFAGMGEVVLKVPRSVHVIVRAFICLGEIDAMGEKKGGICIMAHEENLPGPDPNAPYGSQEPTATLEINAHMFMGEIRIVQVDDRKEGTIIEPVQSIQQLEGQSNRRKLPQPK
ncbi:MAG TPA: LiaF domain-containing protein [Ktedonobacteraceae bacterium]|nr:LiaF domain-containing protein [Ktedonobacteraceae bacterium]